MAATVGLCLQRTTHWNLISRATCGEMGPLQDEQVRGPAFMHRLMSLHRKELAILRMAPAKRWVPSLCHVLFLLTYVPPWDDARKRPSPVMSPF